MFRSLTIGAVALAFAGMASAAAPEEVAVQGLYEGTSKDANGQHKLVARVVATGNKAYKVYVRDQGGPKVVKTEMDGKTDGDAVTFAGKGGDPEWRAAYTNGGAIKGTIGKDGSLELNRVVKAPPTLGAKPPPGAILILPDGKTLDGVVIKVGKDGKAPEVKVAEDGGLTVPKGGLTSKQQVEGSFNLHVEFKNPLQPAQRGQGRGNSGVYLPNGEEIQVLDSFGMDTYLGGGCGGIYKYKDPDAFDKFSLASLPPEQWQCYDVEYRVEKASGKVRVTVLHNGVKIHDNFELQKKAKSGSFYFQDHGNPVQYKNIWVVLVDVK